MIRINLLPHREARRKQNKNAFYRMIALAAIFAAVIGGMVYGFIQSRISEQTQRNEYIKHVNADLDKQIAEIATLKDEIAALKARQQAVEDLQSDRNQPVYLLDELVKQIPEGVFLRSFKQEGQKVSLSGTAQSNERVSELLGNLTHESQWLERPELAEIRSNTMGSGRELKKVYDFSMSVSIKRARDADKQAGDAKKASSDAVVAPAVSAPAASVPAAASAGTPASASAAASPSASGPAASQASGSAPKKP